MDNDTSSPLIEFLRQTRARLPETVDPLRVRTLRGGNPQPGARYVLYWMQINRRPDWNPALSHAIELANALELPLLVYEGLRCDYPDANARIHTFMLEGARERHAQLRARGAATLFYLQLHPGEHRDTVERLCESAAVLVTDHFPTFIISGQTRKLLERTRLPVFSVDGSTIVPLKVFPKAEFAARTLRPRMHRALPEYLHPVPEPALRVRAEGALATLPWATDLETPVGPLVKACDIDQSVRPCPLYKGGTGEARRRLGLFVRQRLARYADDRNNPSIQGTSCLSPYLHFGMISPNEVALEAIGASAPESQTAAFIEELVVRRELSFNFCEYTRPFDGVAGLPPWAQKTLAERAGDRREVLWTPQQIATASTHDGIWNLTQRELLATGKIHGYMRMLWGKKLLEYSASPAEAVRIMIDLHQRYALDGRDPNTYVGILWCLGLHDRAWGPSRPVYGLIRYMSSEAMRKKADMGAYRRWVEYTEALQPAG